MFICKDEPIKRMETRPRRNTQEDYPTTEVWRKEKTRRLPYICCSQTTLHLMLVNATDAGQSLCLFPFHHISVVGQSFCVFSSWTCFHPFYRFIPISKDFLQKNFYSLFLLFFWWVCFAEFNSNHPRFICASFCSRTR